MPPYSGSLSFSATRTINDCNPGDIITFRVISEYLPTSKNYTASISEGSLTVDIVSTLNGNYPYATSSIAVGNFISDSESPNVLILNSSLQGFLGNYTQVPIFSIAASGYLEIPNRDGSGTVLIDTETVVITNVTSSMYSLYGDISYPFSLETADKIVMTGQNGRTQEVDIITTETSPVDGKFRIYVSPNLNPYFIDNPDKIANFLIVKRIKDEQNIILQFKKPEGATSYGFVISDDIDPNLINNISTIQTNVQNQLLSTQENTG